MYVPYVLKADSSFTGEQKEADSFCVHGVAPTNTMEVWNEVLKKCKS
jgi:hypothetical protein